MLSPDTFRPDAVQPKKKWTHFFPVLDAQINPLPADLLEVRKYTQININFFKVLFSIKLRERINISADNFLAVDSCVLITKACSPPLFYTVSGHRIYVVHRSGLLIFSKTQICKNVEGP